MTDDPNEAVRFARQQDAMRVIHWLLESHKSFLKAVEHGWHDKAPVEPGYCELCGEKMPPGEEMFKFHGYSGPCPRDSKEGKANAKL